MKKLILFFMTTYLIANPFVLYKNKQYKQALKELERYKQNNVSLALKAKIYYKLHEYKKSKKLIEYLLSQNIPKKVKKELLNYLNNIKIKQKTFININAGITINKTDNYYMGGFANILAQYNLKYLNFNNQIDLQGEFENFFNHISKNMSLFTAKTSITYNSNLNYSIYLKYQKMLYSLNKESNFISIKTFTDKNLKNFNIGIGIGYSILNYQSKYIHSPALIFRSIYKNKSNKIKVNIKLFSEDKNKNIEYTLNSLFKIQNSFLYLKFSFINTYFHNSNNNQNTYIIKILHSKQLNKYLALNTSFNRYYKSFENQKKLNYEIKSYLSFKY